jgi:drug/metabolite transporter (DMT)-like permease
MNARGIFFIIIVSLGFAGSSICMKLGMNRLGKFTLGSGEYLPFLLRVITSPFVLLGCALGIVGTLFYLDLLSKYSLNLVYPSLSLVYILVAVAGILFLGEKITLLNWAGILLICVGVGVISIKG